MGAVGVDPLDLGFRALANEALCLEALVLVSWSRTGALETEP